PVTCLAGSAGLVQHTVASSVRVPSPADPLNCLRLILWASQTMPNCALLSRGRPAALISAASTSSRPVLSRGTDPISLGPSGQTPLPAIVPDGPARTGSNADASSAASFSVPPNTGWPSRRVIDNSPVTPPASSSV